MPKGRRTNNRHKRKRLPPDNELISRGTQSGSLRDRSKTLMEPIPLKVVAPETDNVFKRLKRRITKRPSRHERAITKQMMKQRGDR